MTSVSILVIFNIISVQIFSNQEKAGQKGLAKYAHLQVGGHYELKSIFRIISNFVNGESELSH